jgi:hypothetical protein
MEVSAMGNGEFLLNSGLCAGLRIKLVDDD